MTSLTKKIPLMEKFGPTVQGEGATIGLQTYFLRFGLCDYECVMCDSMHAVDPKRVKENGMWLTQDQIADMFQPTLDIYPTRWITLSGGNPCIHELTYLITRLKANGYKFAVETQGTLCPSWLHDCDLVTVSPKSPGMGEKFELNKYRFFIGALAGTTSVNTKIVIFDARDIEFAEEVARHWIFAGYSMDDFYLSQGNPFPPGRHQNIGANLHVDILKDKYLQLFDLIKQNTILSNAKWLPQWHVWLWSNKQGV